MDCFVAFAPRKRFAFVADNDDKDIGSRSRGAKFAPRVVLQSSPPNQRAQGMPGAWCARSRAWWVESTRVSHHGHTGNTRHSPRNGFNGFLRALLGDRACLPPSSAELLPPT